MQGWGSWLGDQAKTNGLVDELGGIDRALELVKQKARIPASENVAVVMYPARQSVLELLMKRSQDDATVEARLAAKLRPIFGRFIGLT